MTSNLESTLAPPASVTTFEDFSYTRPDLDALSNAFEQHLSAFHAAPNAEAQSDHLIRLNAVRDEFWTMYNLCYIRHTANTADPFYEQENEFFDENLPAYEALNNRFFRALLASPFRDALEKKYGPQLFTLAELALKTFQPDILEDLQQENALSTEYTKIKAQAQIDFDGKTYNLSSLYPIELSDERAVRRRASAAKWQFYAGKAPVVEQIFDDLVKTRHRMAQKLGFKNFVEVGYARMRRSDYSPEMVANFRRQVRVRHHRAAYGRPCERQRRRLGLEKSGSTTKNTNSPAATPNPKARPKRSSPMPPKCTASSRPTPIRFSAICTTHT